jgi:addiction module HigA family antidote
MKMFNPPHPGFMLAMLLEDNNIKAKDLALRIHVSASTISRLLKEKISLTPELAAKLAAAFGSPTTKMWLGFQADYDAWQAEQNVDVSNIERYVLNV